MGLLSPARSKANEQRVSLDDIRELTTRNLRLTIRPANRALNNTIFFSG